MTSGSKNSWDSSSVSQRKAKNWGLMFCSCWGDKAWAWQSAAVQCHVAYQTGRASAPGTLGWGVGGGDGTGTARRAALDQRDGCCCGRPVLSDLRFFKRSQKSVLLCKLSRFTNGSDSFKMQYGGAWVAQLVGRPTSAQVMISQFVSSSPTSGWLLSARGLLGTLCFPPHAPTPLLLMLSLSKINNILKKN